MKTAIVPQKIDSRFPRSAAGFSIAASPSRFPKNTFISPNTKTILTSYLHPAIGNSIIRQSEGDQG